MSDYLNMMSIVLNGEYSGITQIVFLFFSTALLVLQSRGNRNGNGLLSRIKIIEHDMRELKKSVEKSETKRSQDIRRIFERLDTIQRDVFECPKK